MCHILFLIPFFAPILFFFLPFDQALLLYCFILIFCAILFWFIWKDYRRPVTTGIEGMIGGVGKVMRNGRKAAKVFYKGEIWDAICVEDVSIGESVVVTGLEKMKLIVQKGAGTQ